MILLFGGTTEGRKAIKELEEAGTLFYYSTKTGEQDVTLHHGVRIDGAMDGTAMRSFCRAHGVRLLVDAAHPFAEVLHRTVANVAEALQIPAIRFERVFPQRDADVVWCADYDTLLRHVAGLKGQTVLSTLGVQSIARLKPLEEHVRMIYRILPRESSIALAQRQGATDDQLCYYHEGADERKMLELLRPDAILLKESGLTGGFAEKVAAARALGIKTYALMRPATPAVFHQVDGEHGLRRMVERLLPEFYPLHSGLTTGTCATAASVAAALRLLTGETPAEVPVVLPNGETIPVGVSYGDGYASVFKEAGDDPDVTNGLEVRACVRPSTQFEILGGEGIGTITLPGFDYPPGSPAINKAPRQMIRENLERLFVRHSLPHRLLGSPSLSVLLSVPKGREIANRTFNPRLSIEGGISIIGVSGIVKPFSEEGFLRSIRKCMEVARAAGCNRVVINSGAKSERFVKACYPELPPQVFVEYGNYIGETIKMAAELDIRNVTLGVMLGKAVKLAAGNLDTHSRRTVMDKRFIDQLLEEAGCDTATRQKAQAMTLARELWQIVPEEQLVAFAQVVKSHCLRHCVPLLPDGTLVLLLIDEEGRVY